MRLWSRHAGRIPRGQNTPHDRVGGTDPAYQHGRTSTSIWS